MVDRQQHTPPNLTKSRRCLLDRRPLISDRPERESCPGIGAFQCRLLVSPRQHPAARSDVGTRAETVGDDVRSSNGPGGPAFQQLLDELSESGLEAGRALKEGAHYLSRMAVRSAPRPIHQSPDGTTDPESPADSWAPCLRSPRQPGRRPAEPRQLSCCVPLSWLDEILQLWILDPERLAG